MKGMYPTLEYWRPYRELEGKQDPDETESDRSEDILGGKAEETLDQISRLPSKGDLQKRVKLRFSEKRNVGFVNYKVLRD